MTTFPITAPFPIILDDPSTQIVSLPSHPTLHIAPLRNPVPSRAVGVPAPLEPNAAATKDERARLGRGRVTKKSKHDKKSTEKPTSIQALIQPEVPPLVKLPAFVNLAAIENKLPPYRALNDRPPKRVKLDTDHIQLPKLPPKESRPRPFGPFTIVNGLHEPPPGANLLPPMDSEGDRNLTIEEKSLDTEERRSKTRAVEEEGLKEKRTAEEKPKERQTVDETVLKERKGNPTRVPEVKDPEKKAQDEKRTAEVDCGQTATRKAKSRKDPKKWTEVETYDLLRGVAKYGVGKWKQIKEDLDLVFNDRSTVDLKDRFRVCCPKAYQSRMMKSVEGENVVKTMSQPTESSTHASRQATSSTINKYTAELSRLQLEIDQIDSTREVAASRLPIHESEKPPKDDKVQYIRRARQRWSQVEDDNLLEGLAKHGMAWSTIHQDSTLQLSHRRPQDLRDRIRTRFPEGYKLAPRVAKCEESPKKSDKAKERKKKSKEKASLYREDSKEANTEAPGLPSLTTLDGWDWDNNTLPPLWEEMGI